MRRPSTELLGTGARLGRTVIPAAMVVAAARPRSTSRQRAWAAGGLLAFWSAVYTRYRRKGRAQTAREFELLRTANWETYTRHYNEQVPTIEEEFEIWGDYHQYRHEMRYDLVAAQVDRHLPDGGAILDVGCGSAMVADRLLHRDGRYVGLDFGGHHVTYAAKKHADIPGQLHRTFARGDGERLPFEPKTFDLVVMSEVIEHLLRPERAVWEIARVLKDGGFLVLTTNNASEVPLRSPLSHLFAWLEKAFGAYHPRLISLRPWVWPWPMDRSILAAGAPDVWLPHTHHIYGESRRLLAAAGLDAEHFSTFEFPPPQAATSTWLQARGEAGKRVVDVMEAVATHLPLVKRLGCHVLIVARKARAPVEARPPRGVWPGPFST